MRLMENTLDEFVSMIKNLNRKIVVYGAGVIGKTTLPTLMEDWQLSDQILFIADADIQKHEEIVRIGDKNISVCSPDRFKDTKEDFVILITGSRYDAILKYLGQLDRLAEVDTFILPQMLAKECRFFEKQKIERTSDTPLIPKVIHYCWFGRNKLPEELKKCKESWSRFCPNYRIIEWNEDNYDIEKHMYTKQAYMHKKWGFIPDIARLEILYKHGGIYLDTDVELIRSLDDLLYQPGFVGVEKWGIINIGGGCGVIPNHPVLRKILEYRLSFPFERRDGSLNLESSGSYESKPLMDCGFRPNNTLQTVDGMTVYTSDFFHPFDYMSRELCITANTYGIHHFTGSWV